MHADVSYCVWYDFLGLSASNGDNIDSGLGSLPSHCAHCKIVIDWIKEKEETLGSSTVDGLISEANKGADRYCASCYTQSVVGRRDSLSTRPERQSKGNDLDPSVPPGDDLDSTVTPYDSISECNREMDAACESLSFVAESYTEPVSVVVIDNAAFDESLESSSRL